MLSAQGHSSSFSSSRDAHPLQYSKTTQQSASSTLQQHVPTVLRTGSGRIVLRVLSPQDEYPERILQLPANIGRVFDQTRAVAGPRNGLFRSSYLSRHHALIRLDGNKVVVEDLGSCNGTFVNGAQVCAGQCKSLQDGDIVQFGTEDDQSADAAIVVQILLSSSLAMERRGPPSTQGFTSFCKTSLPLEEKEKENEIDVAIIGDKIAAVSRNLAALGVQVRTDSGYDGKGILRVLGVVEQMLQQLEQAGPSTPPNDPHHQAHPTIHQQPHLASALCIIRTYEMIFCLLAFLFVAYTCWQ